jgi:hypothetical protein
MSGAREEDHDYRIEAGPRACRVICSCGWATAPDLAHAELVTKREALVEWHVHYVARRRGISAISDRRLL